MPTYNYRCKECGLEASVFCSIRRYVDGSVGVPVCPQHGYMERLLCTMRGSAISYGANFGDRHYLDLKASDGTPIDSRTKHREYMRAHGLTTMDDFKGEWNRDLSERETFRKAERVDKELRNVVADAVYGRIGNGRRNA